MTKTKIILGLTMMFSILAITATSASAKFHAVTSGRTSGSSILQLGTIAVLEITPGNATLLSSKAPDTWKIQDSKAEQNVTKDGEHLDQEINFEGIRAGGLPVRVNNRVVVQYVQISKTESYVSISKNIVIELEESPESICKIKFLAGENKHLTKVTDIDLAGETAMELTAEITHLRSTSEPEAPCALLNIPPEAGSGVFKQVSIERGVVQL